MTTSPPDPAACIAALPLDLKIGQTLMVGVSGDGLDAARPAVTEGRVGGVILMTWPDSSDPAVLLDLRSSGPLPLLVAVDEEGGEVQRLRSLGVLPSARAQADTMSVAEVEALIAEHARSVAALGIDVVFAPVADVAPLDGPGSIGDRTFSDDPAIVTAFAAATARGWMSAGILPVLKHFPGHGSASGDTHDAPAQTPSLDILRARDLVPYQQLAGSGVGVMVDHLDVPGLTDGAPASVSPAAISGLLRSELGYGDALVFSDALGMEAIVSRYGLGDAAARSIAAGADVALFVSPQDIDEVARAIETAVAEGRLPLARLDQAVDHILRAKGIDPCRV